METEPRATAPLLDSTFGFSAVKKNQKQSLTPAPGYRHGETITTSFAESTVNQVISKRMVKKQQMRWTRRGAHLLLQVRTRVLNDDLRADFERWYPGLKAGKEPTHEAAV